MLPLSNRVFMEKVGQDGLGVQDAQRLRLASC